ncbi:MAG: glutathione S-transferase family protein [Pseudomonadota bacterium]
MTDSSLFPITIYGSSISYFTGKLENYCRVRGIPYDFMAMTDRKIIRRETGSTQMPVVTLADGRWLTDTTGMIQWLEADGPGDGLIPSNPLQRFFSLLLEDYADEWLWRPAMHFRWFYPSGARFASDHLGRELGASVKIPMWVKRRILITRQRGGYTVGDGITPDQVPAVEAIFYRTLAQLQSIFAARPFLLGDRPSLADIAFSGPFFRHFALDPVPAEIVRQQAPAVWEWSSRLWNTRLADCSGELQSGIPDDWGAILDEVGGHYLPYLCANVDAVSKGTKRFNVSVGGVQYTGARWSRYRVWCLKRLRDHFEALTPPDQAEAQSLLEQHGCWEPLWRQKELPIAAGFCERLPFRAGAKMIDAYEND